ncbi:MAG: anti-sigma factor RsbA family regulatory protein [Janthinobacterium lividum]
MTTAAPVRARQSYRHEAFLWRTRSDYVAGLVPFIREGVEAGEAVMAVLLPEHAAWVSAELGPAAAEVHFFDMLDLGHNPARIIPAWLEFLEASCGRGRPARGVGEPIWPGRSTAEVRECQLHEALLNLAVDPELPFWLLCPYDAAHLEAEVLTEAGRSHPALVTASSYEGSGLYRGHEHARALFTTELPEPPADAARVSVTLTNLADAAEQVTLQSASRLWSDQVVRLADVVRGLAEDGLRRGALRVDVQLWDEPTNLVCQVSDRTVIEDFLVGRRLVPYLEQDSVWAANQVCDLVQVRSTSDGTTVRLHVAK